MNRKTFVIATLVAALAMLVSLPAMANKTAALNERLAAQNVVKGEKVKYVPGFTLEGWTFVDPRHMTVMGAESKRYLVNLQKCYGLNLPKSSLLTRNSKPERLAKHDTFLVKSEGQTIAHCDVRAVYELIPINS